MANKHDEHVWREDYPRTTKGGNSYRAELHRLHAKWDEERKEMIAELNAVGIDVDSCWSIKPKIHPYEVVRPILLRHLKHDYYKRNKEGIIRALRYKEGRGELGPILIEEFKKETHPNTKATIAVTMETVADKNDIEGIKEIIADTSHGYTRCPFLEVLARLEGKKCIPTLLKYLDEDVMWFSAIKALGDVKAVECRDIIANARPEKYNMEHTKVMKKALAKIDRYIARQKKLKNKKDTK